LTVIPDIAVPNARTDDFALIGQDGSAGTISLTLRTGKVLSRRARDYYSTLRTYDPGKALSPTVPSEAVSYQSYLRERAVAETVHSETLAINETLDRVDAALKDVAVSLINAVAVLTSEKTSVPKSPIVEECLRIQTLVRRAEACDQGPAVRQLMEELISRTRSLIPEVNEARGKLKSARESAKHIADYATLRISGFCVYAELVSRGTLPSVIYEGDSRKKEYLTILDDTIKLRFRALTALRKDTERTEASENGGGR
jgi:hypothetical protein